MRLARPGNPIPNSTPKPTPNLRRRWLILGLALVCGWASAAEVLQSHPQAGATLASAPQEIRVWFDVDPMTPTTQVQIIGPGQAGGVVAVRSLHTMGEQDLMGFVLDEMAPGDYRLEWQVGEETGAIPFAIKPE